MCRQVFATDIDSRAIITARARHLPRHKALLSDSPARFARFSRPRPMEVPTASTKASVTCWFSEQDVIQDPPFSRLDLDQLSQRSDLITGGELQSET
jgi:two-component system CheB/CheR fusion protein